MSIFRIHIEQHTVWKLYENAECASLWEKCFGSYSSVNIISFFIVYLLHFHFIPFAFFTSLLFTCCLFDSFSKVRCTSPAPVYSSSTSSSNWVCDGCGEYREQKSQTKRKTEEKINSSCWVRIRLKLKRKHHQLHQHRTSSFRLFGCHRFRFVIGWACFLSIYLSLVVLFLGCGLWALAVYTICL